MGSDESLKASLRGLTVGVDDLDAAARWVDRIQQNWDDWIVDGIRRHVTGSDAAKSAKPFGHFEEADILHKHVGSGQRDLVGQAKNISTVLGQLREATSKIADNYQGTELDNAANQKKLVSLLDGSMSQPGADGSGRPGAAETGASA